MIPPPKTTTFAMQSAKLRDKLVERHAKQFALTVRGVDGVDVIQTHEAELSEHEKAHDKFCKLDAKPLQSWPVSIDDSTIIAWVCSRLSQHGGEVYIPFEAPFAIKVGRIVDGSELIKSIWAEHKTRDVTLFLQHPFGVIEVQDLEYEVSCFEATTCDR